MSDFDYAAEASDLVSAISERITADGVGVAQKIAEASDLTLEWLGYLHNSELTGHCDDFLDGVRSLVLEAMASGSAGLHRSAMFSMRGQVDLIFSWLYFKDHPVEWQRVERENEGYKLRGDTIAYLESYYPDFKKKLGIMGNNITRTVEDPYKTLSAHIHSVGSSTIPKITQFSDVVADSALCKQLADLQSGVSEYGSDILISAYGAKWASLPEKITDSIKSRLPADKLAIVFA